MHKYKYLIFITDFSFPVIQVNKRYSVPLSCTLFTSSKIFTLLFQNFLSLNITGLEGAITRVSKDVTFFNSLSLHPLSLTFFSLSLPSNSLFFYFPHISSHRSSISHRLYPSSRVLRQCEDEVIYSLIKAS